MNTNNNNKPRIVIISVNDKLTDTIVDYLEKEDFYIEIIHDLKTGLQHQAKQCQLIILAAELLDSSLEKTIYEIKKYNQPLIVAGFRSKAEKININIKPLHPIDFVLFPILKNFFLNKVNIFLRSYYTESQLNFVTEEVVQIKAELQEQNKQLKYLALNDVLTSTYNRYYFEKATTQLINISKRYKRNFAAILLDIDNFKWINDRFGHNIGDEVLKAVAKKLRNSIRDADLIARIGGDEFGIILTEVKNNLSASLVAKKILNTFSIPLRINQKSIRISLSIGITHFSPAETKNYKDIMEEADIAMYRAKNNGKDCFEYYITSMKDSYNYQNILNYELHNSLKRRELFLNYQPIIDIHTNRIIGIESLIRWANPKLGNIPPLDFIPVAEQTGLIHDVGNWVLEESCRQLAEWKSMGFNDIFISVNISPIQLKNLRFGEELANITEKYGITPNEIELEITESVFTSDIDKYITFLNEFKNRLSIDDFGAQHSSLARLGKIPIITLKIDGSLLNKIEKYPKNKIILRHLLALAKELSVKVVAEHVANANDVAFLKNYRHVYAQGFYFYKPMPAKDISDILSEKNINSRAYSGTI